MRADPPARRLLAGPQHLQLAALQARAGQDLGKEGLEIGPAADDDPLAAKLASVCCLDASFLDVSDQRLEMKRDTVPLVQPAGNCADRFAGIDAELGRAPQAADQ